MASKTCLWHECSKTFEPHDARQKFCGPACQTARKTWTMRRGPQLVNILLRGNAAELVAAKVKLETEIKENTP